MMIISKHKRHRNDPKHHHLSHLCKTILHHCNSFMSAHSVRRQLSCGRWEETLLTRRQDMGTSVQGFLLSYLSFFNIHWLLILLLIGLITGYFEGRRKCWSGHSYLAVITEKLPVWRIGIMTSIVVTCPCPCLATRAWNEGCRRLHKVLQSRRRLLLG